MRRGKKITRREFVKGVAIGSSILLGSSLLGCAEEKPTPEETPKPTPTPSPEKTPTPSKEPIKIGVLAPFSGPFSQYGPPFLNGAKMAVEEINAKGGVLGRPLELSVRDTKNDPNSAATSFEELTYSEKVVAAIGPVSSDIGLATSRKAEELQIPLILHLAVTEKIHKKNNRYTFRTNPSAPLWMVATAEYIKEKGYKRIGAIIADYSFGHSIKAGIEKHIASIPGVTVQVEVAPVREKDFTPYLRKLKDLDPEFFVATGHPPGCKVIMKQALELGFKSEGYVGPALLEDEWVSALGEKVTEGAMAFAATDYGSEEYKKVAEKYREKYGDYMNNMAVDGYVNIYHLAWALNQAGSDDPKKLADTIRNGRFEIPLFIYPLSYTEWGDLKEPRLALEAFRAGPPSGNVNPGANWHIETIFVSSTLIPPEPES